MLRHVSLISLLFAGAPACTELSAEDAATGSTEQAVIDCTEWQCGSNSPVIDALGFHELNTAGLANTQGMIVMGLHKGSLSFTLSVERGHIIGRNGAMTLAGIDLEGSQIWIRHGTKTFAIRITTVAQTTMFAKVAGQPQVVETYLLDVNELINGAPTTAPWTNLCKNPPPRESVDRLGMNSFHSVVFEGERFNAGAKTISSVLQPAWFNVGCAGHTLAKMVMTGHVEAVSTLGFSTTIPERQAMLKMLSGDYCGGGHAMTVPGEPLRWWDAHNYNQYPVGLSLELEARWTPAGAACINTPRVDANPTALGAAVFPAGVTSVIQAECPSLLLQPCPLGVNDFDGKYLLSANPI